MTQPQNTLASPHLIIPGINADGIATLHNTKNIKQYCKTVETLLTGGCPFCQIDRKINVVLHENASWVIWKSAFPQKHQDLHLVIPHRRHIKDLSELTPQDYIDLGEIITWATINFDLPGGGLALRFGDSDRHAGSVPGHLHVNIQIPSKTGRVQVTLCKDPEEILEKTKILLVFEKLRLGTPVEELSPEELELVKGRI